MKPLLQSPVSLAGLLLAATLCPATAHAAAPSPTIQQRIDALLRHKLRPEPLPIDPPNPFLMISGGIRDLPTDGTATKPASRPENEASLLSPGPNPAELASNNSSEVLMACAGRLKIGGIITIKDQVQIVINGVPRKEGDIISVEWNNSVVNLRVVRLVPSQITLRFGDAEAAIKF